jgi:predicted SprT family Zn-dependent metalloprotease
MSFLVIEDERPGVYRYICQACGEEVDCNERFDKKPNASFCKFCGEDLSEEGRI